MESYSTKTGRERSTSPRKKLAWKSSGSPKRFSTTVGQRGVVTSLQRIIPSRLSGRPILLGAFFCCRRGAIFALVAESASAYSFCILASRALRSACLFTLASWRARSMGATNTLYSNLQNIHNATDGTAMPSRMLRNLKNLRPLTNSCMSTALTQLVVVMPVAKT